ncbi:hypothetical protein [Coleofasciculus sp.]|uniref:hypothetical protein n=1 Tax=Coleofasciculus sp. TaxID=3100458 RepID=UPI0039F9F8B2
MESVENVALPFNLRGENALAAIVFTDVESFTPKMAADETHTLSLIQRDFEQMSGFCQRFDGQVLKTLGDGLLMYLSVRKKPSCVRLRFKQPSLQRRLNCQNGIFSNIGLVFI